MPGRLFRASAAAAITYDICSMLPRTAALCADRGCYRRIYGEAEMAQAQYYVEINNDYLKKHRRVTGRTRREVELKVLEQQQRWSEQERRARERDAIADFRERARLATDNAQALLEEYRNILISTLSVD